MGVDESPRGAHRVVHPATQTKAVTHHRCCGTGLMAGPGSSVCWPMLLLRQDCCCSLTGQGLLLIISPEALQHGDRYMGNRSNSSPAPFVALLAPSQPLPASLLDDTLLWLHEVRSPPNLKPLVSLMRLDLNSTDCADWRCPLWLSILHINNQSARSRVCHRAFVSLRHTTPAACIASAT